MATTGRRDLNLNSMPRTNNSPDPLSETDSPGSQSDTELLSSSSETDSPTSSPRPNDSSTSSSLTNSPALSPGSDPLNSPPSSPPLPSSIARLSSSTPVTKHEVAQARNRYSNNQQAETKEISSTSVSTTSKRNLQALHDEIKPHFSSDVISKAIEFTQEENIYIASLFITIADTQTPLILYYENDLLDSMERLIELLKDHPLTKDQARLFTHRQTLPLPKEKSQLNPEARVVIPICHGRIGVKYNSYMNAFESCNLRKFTVYLGDVSAELAEKDPAQKLKEEKEKAYKSIDLKKKGRKNNLIVTTHHEAKETNEYKKAETLVKQLIESNPTFYEVIRRDAYSHLQEKHAEKAETAKRSNYAPMDTKMELPSKFVSALGIFISQQLDDDTAQTELKATIESHDHTAQRIFSCYQRKQQEPKFRKDLVDLGLDPDIMVSLPADRVAAILDLVCAALKTASHTNGASINEDQIITKALIKGIRIFGVLAAKKSQSPLSSPTTSPLPRPDL